MFARPSLAGVAVVVAALLALAGRPQAQSLRIYVIDVEQGAPTVLRNGAQFSLNNEGDTVTLFSPGNQARDTFTYVGSTEGVRITTGH